MTSPLATVSTYSTRVLASITPTRATLIMIVALGFLGGMAWVHVSEKEEYLIQRNFRLLNLWSQDISHKIQSYQQVLKNGASEIKEALNSTPNISPITTEDGRHLFVNSNKDDTSPKPNSQLPVTWICGSGFLFNQSSTASTPMGNLDRNPYKRMCEAEGLVEIHTYKKSTQSNSQQLKQKPQLKSQPLEVVSNSLGPVIQVTYSSEPTTDMEIVGTINLDVFLQRLTNKAIFSNVLLVIPPEPGEDNNTAAIPLFQFGTNGFSWEDLTKRTQSIASQSWLMNLLGLQEPPTQNAKVNLATGDHHFLFDVPGRSYQGFSHPIPIPGTANQNWVLIGFMEDSAFSHSTMAISSTVLLGVMITFLSLVIAIPLFHLRFLGPTDPLRLTHVLGLVLAALLGTGLVTFWALDTTIYWEGKKDLRQHMERSAQTIKDRFIFELRAVLSTLTRFDDSEPLRDDFQRVTHPASNSLSVGERPVLLGSHIQKDLKGYTKEMCNSQIKDSGPQPIRQDSATRPTSNASSTTTEPCTSNKPSEPSPYYSDFLYAFWMDPDGSMRINWARDTFHEKPVQGITDNIALNERKYVETVLHQARHLWQLAGCETDSQQEVSARDACSFFLEPIISWTTGYNTVVASMPSTLKDPTSKENWVAAIEFKFTSLMDNVVLPPGIGFAVIDETDHRVLFHSERWRNLREKFLVETDENPTLRDLLSAKMAGHAEGSYWGEPTSFYVLPLSPVPWTLVVFRDMEILRSVNLMGLLVAASLYGFWALIVYWILWIVLKGQGRHRKVPWLWPDRRSHHFYQKVLIYNMGWFLVGLLSIWFSGNPDVQLLLGLLIPVVWLGGLALMIKSRRPSSTSTKARAQSFLPDHMRSLWAFPYSYSLMLTSCLFLLGVIPAYGSFSSVFHQEIALFSQYQLLETLKTFQSSGKTIMSQAEWQRFAPINAVGLDKNCNEDDHQDPPNSVSQHSLGLYPDFFLNSSWNLCPLESLPPERKHRLFENVFALFSHPFTPLLKHVSLWGFVGDAWPKNDNGLQIRWNKKKDSISLYSPVKGIWNTSDQETLPPVLRLKATMPLMPWFLSGHLPEVKRLTVGNFVGYLFVIGFVAFWLIKVPKFIADRVLFLSYTHPMPCTLSSLLPIESPELTINRLLLGFPGQGKTTFLTSNFESLKVDYPGVVHFDLKTHPPTEWQTAFLSLLLKKQEHQLQNIHVFLDHLDYQWKDPAINQHKLEFLEFLFNLSSSLEWPQMDIDPKQPFGTESHDHIQSTTATTTISPSAY